jgi:NDP-sugar pyrophosphorylase family protein
MKLLILAGGFGTRIQSVMPGIPKALAPIGDAILLELQINNWKRQGIRDFVFLLHYQGMMIKDFIDSRIKSLLNGCRVQYSFEPIPLGTGGSIAYAIKKLNFQEDFIVANADTWVGDGLEEIQAKSSPCILVTKVDNISRYGGVKFDSQGNIISFVEKGKSVEAGWINAGIYKLSPFHFYGCPNTFFSIESHLFPTFLNSYNFQAVKTDSYFMDIGIPEDYEKFCATYNSRILSKNAM